MDKKYIKIKKALKAYNEEHNTKYKSIYDSYEGCGKEELIRLCDYIRIYLMKNR